MPVLSRPAVVVLLLLAPLDDPAPAHASGWGAPPAPAPPEEVREPASPPAAAEAPPPPEAPPPAADTAGNTPAQTRDRLLLDGALEAVLLGDLYRAEGLFVRLSLEGSTAEVRISAGTLAERVRALAGRRALLPAPALPGQRAPRVRRPEPARPFFVLTSTVLGLALWGWTLPLALGVDPDDNPRVMLGLYMSGGAASFAVPYLVTRRREITWGEANLAFYGGTRGMEYGLLVSNLLFGTEGGDIEDNDLQAFSASLLLGSVGGLTAGTWWAGRANMTSGQARTLAVLADYGLFAGFTTGHLLGLDDLTSGDGVARLDARARSMSAAGLTGTVLGIAGGRLLSLARDNTWGDGEVMRMGGLVGVLAGATTAAVGDYLEDSRPALATMTVAGGLGLWLGDALVRDTNFSAGSAVLIDLATVAGGLGAAGVTYLIDSNGGPAEYLLASTLGAVGVGGLTYYALSDERASGPRASRTAGWSLLPRFTPGGRGRGQLGLSVLGAF